jgi:hypothetical protein
MTDTHTHTHTRPWYAWDPFWQVHFHVEIKIHRSSYCLPKPMTKSTFDLIDRHLLFVLFCFSFVWTGIHFNSMLNSSTIRTWTILNISSASHRIDLWLFSKYELEWMDHVRCIVDRRHDASLRLNLTGSLTLFELHIHWSNAVVTCFLFIRCQKEEEEENTSIPLSYPKCSHCDGHDIQYYCQYRTPLCQTTDLCLIHCHIYM